jgi:hypothetical protein
MRLNAIHYFQNRDLPMMTIRETALSAGLLILGCERRLRP